MVIMMNKPCIKCGCTERYNNKNKACKNCARVRARRIGVEKAREKARIYRENNREKFRESVRNAHKKYRENNRDKVNEKAAKRRAVKRMAIPKWFGEFDDFVMKEAFSLARDRENETGIKWDVDHIVPLSAINACGLHCASNIRVIPAFINRSRKNNYED